MGIYDIRKIRIKLLNLYSKQEIAMIMIEASIHHAELKTK